MTAIALRRVAWRHPETGAAVVAALAWSMLLALVAGPPELVQSHAELHRRAPVLSGAIGWMLMTIAMMVPAALPVARDHALGAVWARRGRTVRLFLTSFVAVWLAFGAVAAAIVAVAGGILGASDGALLAGALAAAAAWELTACKWRAVRACHLIRPLPPRGARADVECVRSGLVYGRRCVLACWPVMLAMIVAGHESIGLMVALTLVVGVEKVVGRPARFALPIATVLAADAFVTLAA